MQQLETNISHPPSSNFLATWHGSYACFRLFSGEFSGWINLSQQPTNSSWVHLPGQAKLFVCCLDSQLRHLEIETDHLTAYPQHCCLDRQSCWIVGSAGCLQYTLLNQHQRTKYQAGIGRCLKNKTLYYLPCFNRFGDLTLALPEIPGGLGTRPSPHPSSGLRLGDIDPIARNRLVGHDGIKPVQVETAVINWRQQTSIVKKLQKKTLHWKKTTVFSISE